MLHKIKLKTNYRCFKKDLEIEFKPGVNLLTLLKDNNTSVIDIMAADRIETRYFDFEKMNPRMSSYCETVVDVASRFISHGQNNKAIISFLENAKNIILFLDEPDQAMSVRSIYQIIEQMNIAVNAGCQVIAAVHNPLLMKAYPEVLSLEHRRWMKTANFLKSQLKPCKHDWTIQEYKCY